MVGWVNFVALVASAAAQGDGTATGMSLFTTGPAKSASALPPPVSMPTYTMPRTLPPPPAVVVPRNPHIPFPIGASNNWVTPADYPKEALKAEQTGLVVANLTVAPTGRVSGCAIGVSSGFPQLDAASCRLLIARGQFTPATDEAGNPTAGIWSQRVAWTLPGVLPYPPRPAKLEVKITVEADGSQSHCEIVASQGQLNAQLAHAGPVPCSVQKTKPFTDTAGKPVRKVVTYSQYVVVEDTAP